MPESFRKNRIALSPAAGALTLALILSAVPAIVAEDSGAASAAVDPSTLKHKVLFGYQGWFDCPLAGAGAWTHWTRGGAPAEGNLTVDAYPDLREFKTGDLCPAGDFKIGTGQAYLFASKAPAIVDAHFRWMREYGLDGVYVQRFVGETSWKKSTGDVVLRNIMKSAAAHGRVFAIEYDVSGASDAGFAELIRKDWQYLVDSLKVTAAPGYLFEKGRPVVSVWGIGFTENHPPADPAAAAAFIAWFKADAEEKYRAYYMGGTPSWWRLLNQDARTDPAWKAVYRAMDAIQPWSVGRYGDEAGIENWRKNALVPDLAEAKANGNFYLPVVFPGFSWKNLNAGPANQIPRKGGKFLWRQAMNAKAAGAEGLKIAMFDEVDEATAMFKIAAKRSEAPDKGYWLTLDADGMDLPSDWYLRVAGEITKIFHGSNPVSDTIPIRPGDPTALHPDLSRASRASSTTSAPSLIASAGVDGHILLRILSYATHANHASPQAPGRDAFLRVRDHEGRCLRTLVMRDGSARWDRRDEAGREVPAGLYLVSLAGTPRSSPASAGAGMVSLRLVIP